MTEQPGIPAVAGSPAQRRPSVCWIGLGSYNVLSGRGDIRHVGGAEVQRVRISRELAARGYPVSFVTFDHGQADGIAHEGIRAFKSYQEQAGLRGLKFIHPRWTGLWAAMSRADSDIYLVRGADCEAGQAALWCKLHRRPLVFWCANDADCQRNFPLLRTWRERNLARLGLKLADAVVAQTATQARLLREEFGLASVQIPNLGVGPSARSASPPTAGRRPRVLWAGRIVPEKRCDWLLEIAALQPDFDFNVVGPTDQDTPYARQIRDRAAALPNVHLHGERPYSEMPRFYEQAQALCCTSRAEGFPNTFLEAWSVGLPVVTSFDPDQIVAAGGAGAVGGDIAELSRGLGRLLGSAEAWSRASTAARLCAEAHSPRQCVDKFAGVLDKLRPHGGR